MNDEMSTRKERIDPKPRAADWQFAKLASAANAFRGDLTLAEDGLSS
jgi:hypothetical protein